MGFEGNRLSKSTCNDKIPKNYDTNGTSLKKKPNEHAFIAHSNVIDVIMVTETWFNVNFSVKKC